MGWAGHSPGLGSWLQWTQNCSGDTGLVQLSPGTATFGPISAVSQEMAAELFIYPVLNSGQGQHVRMTVCE